MVAVEAFCSSHTLNCGLGMSLDIPRHTQQVAYGVPLVNHLYQRCIRLLLLRPFVAHIPCTVN